jgi:hypothetical protein
MSYPQDSLVANRGKTRLPGRLPAVKPVSSLIRFLDRMLVPLMRILGAGTGRVQETHRWHCQRLRNEDSVDETLSLSIDGDDTSRRSNKIFPLPIFHMPIFGGWKRYVVIEILSETPIWHVGWLHIASPPGFVRRSAIQRLPIGTKQIKMLTLPYGNRIRFFALSPDGQQLPLRMVGTGVLGDGRFPGVRLF